MGRRREQAWLDEAFDRAAAGEPAVRIVAGDAGIGKSLLLRDAIERRSRRWLGVVGHCVEAGEQGLPYAPITGILRAIGRSPAGSELLADVRTTAPGVLPLVDSDAVPVDTTTGLNQLRLLDSLTRLLDDLSRRQPTIVAIEDLHWADPSTRAFVSFLCHNLVAQQLVIVLTVRTDELRRAHPVRALLGELASIPDVERIDLRPLDRDTLAELLTRIHGTALPRDVVDSIAARSGGNPFFAEQLLGAGAGQHDGLPLALADVLRHRLGPLSDVARDLLAAASLAGQRVEHDVLLAVSGHDEMTVADALQELVDRQLLDPTSDGSAYRFRHALLAETVAGDLLPFKRRSLHAAYAEVLAETASAAVVTRHRLGANDLAGAFVASRDAALEARAVAARADELAHWERVLELWRHATDEDRASVGSRSSVARAAALAAEDAGEIDRAIDFAQRAIDDADSPADRARAELVLAPLRTPLVTGSPFDEVDAATSAIADAEEAGDHDLVTRGRYVLARAHFHAGRNDEAIPLAERVAADARRLGLPNIALGAGAIHYLASRPARADRLDAGAVKEDELVDTALDCDDVETGLWVLTRLADWWSPIDLHKGEQLAAQAYDYASRRGVRSSVRGVWARETLALCRLLNGNWDAVERLAGDEPLPINDLTAATVALETQVEIHRGRLDRARVRLDQADGVSRDALGNGYVAIAQLSLHLADGNPDGAVAVCVDRLDRLPPYTGFADIEASLVARGVGALADAVEAGIEPPDAPELLAAADRVERRAREHPSQPVTASPLSLLLAHRSRLDRIDAGLWRRALEMRGDRPYDGSVCRFHLAEALLADGDVEAAAAELRTAARTCEQLGAVVLRARVEELAGRARIPLNPADTTPLSGDRWQLTDRERQVLELLAEGCTNRRIGELLFISEKTASVHVSHILGKLQAANRSEAAAIARRYGLLGS